ncbi:MAG TPA: lipopolysaccharide kinase InaA family protein [Gemmatimonadaceae bacterium]|nr:lipopolysaccharide kinase InaA family protein [Gemmatimonadaceae bacterium]
MSRGTTVPGYARTRVRGAEVVALEPLLPAVRQALVTGTLHEFAAAHPEAVALAGRDVAWAAPLPGDGTRVVVRHTRHGGTLAPVTGDLFLFPRARQELETAVRLAAAGVPTPEIVAYVLYRAGIFRRSDVATREIPRASDLARALLADHGAVQKRLLLEATARLIAQLGRAGAHHPDLNLKNVLLAPGPTSRLRAWVLDVDRVTFGAAGDPRVTAANIGRLERSARKWRDERGAPVSEDDLAWLRSAVDRERSRP